MVVMTRSSHQDARHTSAQSEQASEHMGRKPVPVPVDNAAPSSSRRAGGQRIGMEILALKSLAAVFIEKVRAIFG